MKKYFELLIPKKKSPDSKNDSDEVEDISSGEKKINLSLQGTRANKKLIIFISAMSIFFVAFVTYKIFDDKNNERIVKKEQEQIKLSSSQKITGAIGDISNDYSDEKNKKIESKNEEPRAEINKVSKLPTPPPRPPISPVIPKIIQRNNQISETEKEEITAKKSDINFNINVKNSDRNNLSTTVIDKKTNEKESIRFYNSGKVIKGLSAYEVKAGSVIPCSLITGINSDIAGDVVGIVRENVYDTVTGNYLLIPQGSKITGIYDNNIVYGQNRMLVIWQRIMFPNGDSLLLDNMKGIDLGGNVGFKDRTNKHSAELIKGVVLSSLLAAGSSIATGNNSNDNSFSASAGRGASQAIMEVGGKITQKNLDRQPTIEISKGYQFNIFVQSDLKLEKNYE